MSTAEVLWDTFYMTNEDDGEVFEITDFTTASDWERFVSRVEEILHEWKLVSCSPRPPAAKGIYTSGIWEEKTEELKFANVSFQLTHIWLHNRDERLEKSVEKEGLDEEDGEREDEIIPTVFGDLMNSDNDFPSKAHCICRWYGLQDFVILYPSNNSEAVMSESRTKLLLSSVNMALSDAGCSVPIFVQIQQKWRRMYHGTCVLPGSSVEFGMVHLKRIPAQYSHLAGLLDVFKLKMGAVSEARAPVSVAVRFLYVLYDWVNSPWSQPLPGNASDKNRCNNVKEMPVNDYDNEVGYQGFDQLPFGACEDPVSALNLYCTWPSLSEDVIVENQVYSDLDPLQAPQWSVRIQMTDDPQCLLGEYLVNFLALCHRKETLDQLVGNLVGDTDTEADLSNALQKLTEPSMSYNITSLSSYVHQPQTQKPKPRDVPIQGELLDQILQYLFPDAAKPINPEDEVDMKRSRSMESLRNHPVAKELSKQLKSAPVEGLLHRLSICMCVLNQNHGGLFAVAQIWQEFVMEMRYRWENNYIIDGVDLGPPNLGSCILQQKLQMLNCCIEHKKKREQVHKGYTGDVQSTAGSQSPDHGPSTSGTARSMSTEEIFQDENQSEHTGDSSDTVCNVDQSNQSTNNEINQSNLRNTSIDNSSSSQGKQTNNQEANSSQTQLEEHGSSDEEEFFECENENESDEKDVDTKDGNENTDVQREVATTSVKESSGNHPESGADCDTDIPGDREIVDDSVRNQSELNADCDSNIPDEEASNENTIRNQSELNADCDSNIPDEEASNENTIRNQSESDADCDTEVNTSLTGSQSVTSSISIQSESAFKDTFTHKPEGRLAPFQDLKLINCEERMYIPITQEPAPMTEDMLEEHAEVLAKLGTSAEGAELRARMQSACLMSDMESFKAANPGCVLEDFVRWYSPRDYIEENIEDENGQIVSQGHLSLRMQIPGNMWVEVWQTARPVPARRQKRLFDDTREAEKVLHFLQSLKPAEVVVHLLPMLMHAALLKALEKDDAKIPVLKQVIEQATQKACHITRSPNQDIKKYEELTRIIMQAEIIIARNISLQSKFTEDLLDRADARSELDIFVTSILQNSEVMVRGGPMGPAGSVINKLFHAAQRASYMLLDDEEKPQGQDDDPRLSGTSVPNFPRPVAREYILRTVMPRPAPYSKTLPQRMYCAIEEDEFRICGAFGSDSVFQ